MEQISPLSRAMSGPRPAPAPAPVLTVLSSRFRLAQPEQPAPDAWAGALAKLLGWLRVDAEFVPPARPGRLQRLADWRAALGAPVFAPWTGWNPAAFQHGGIAGLPQAQYVASYLIDHVRGAAGAARQSGTDVVLMTPHPAVCVAENAGDVPIPRAAVMRAMIRAARAEGRDRIAIILHARQRNAIARQLLGSGRGLNRDGLALDLCTIEDALPALMSGAAPWDAVIAMPDLRSMVFTVLGHTTGVARAWPMLWFGGDGGLRLVTSEAPGEGSRLLPLDAPAMIHALALSLHEAGLGRAAWRLHDGWARLRDSGVTTAGRGSDGPYVSVVEDSAFLDLLVRDAAASQRPQRPWRALKIAETANSGSKFAKLHVVPSNCATRSHLKGR